MNKKVFVLGGENHMNWMEDLGFTPTKTFNEAGFIFFTGGTDVNPKLYGQPRHRYTERSDIYRDEQEVKFFNEAKKRGMGMLGICRGNQFLAVMNGAELIQHSAHPGYHKITLFDGRVIDINSTHHQQIDLTKATDYELLGWAEKLSPFHENGYGAVNVPKDYKEPEIIWWPKTKCLSTQGHCEWLPNSHIYPKTMREFVQKYFLTN
jgi:hypothetical protein